MQTLERCRRSYHWHYIAVSKTLKKRCIFVFLRFIKSTSDKVIYIENGTNGLFAYHKIHSTIHKEPLQCKQIVRSKRDMPENWINKNVESGEETWKPGMDRMSVCNKHSGLQIIFRCKAFSMMVSVHVQKLCQSITNRIFRLLS